MSYRKHFASTRFKRPERQPAGTRRVAVARILVLLVSGCLCCAGCDGAQTVPILPPKFAVDAVKTDHGVFTAVWYVTIRNDGGPGSMLVQKWVGSSAVASSRKVVYSERVEIGAFQKTTVKVEWTHGGVGAIASALIDGDSDGVSFLP
jgi:hypothetical protein